uniref:Uncharacterized protein n=1 Tax=Oryza sativa subsp. japonica TaxID=39947 RepID=Q6H3Z4_ORYSJ|nr:hypothetical protein [Oryza sativa Japonica Group]BAD26555.1 hypothetical protein [Oryza sativa Japonica Group]
MAARSCRAAAGIGLCAFGTATELLRKLKEARESEEGERKRALPNRDGRRHARPMARGEPSGLGPGKGRKTGARSLASRVLARTGLPGGLGRTATEGGQPCVSARGDARARPDSNGDGGKPALGGELDEREK